MNYFAICSRVEENDAEETIYRIEDTVAQAIKWFGRFVLYRCYGEIPSETLKRLLDTIDKVRFSGDISKEFHLGGIVYYIRSLPEEEAISLAQKDSGC